ncbi:hypothetical protein [Streptomyces sp. S063]|uniref:hypothetical protein n=1 Tax=Streptomyces sp. S063 TaxID=2005885 RepID=UPI001F3BE4C4|nr:hypothetical protein [Streptomyces sp. S063]
MLGTHLERCGDDEGAVEAFREAVALHRSLALETPAALLSALVPAVDDLGRALARTGEHATAIEEFDETVKEFEESGPSAARCLAVERSAFLLPWSSRDHRGLRAGRPRRAPPQGPEETRARLPEQREEMGHRIVRALGGDV